MLLFGGIFYAIFAEGTVQSWADEEKKTIQMRKQLSNPEEEVNKLL